MSPVGIKLGHYDKRTGATAGEKIKRVEAVRGCSELAAMLHLKPKGRLEKKKEDSCLSDLLS